MFVTLDKFGITLFDPFIPLQFTHSYYDATNIKFTLLYVTIQSVKTFLLQ